MIQHSDLQNNSIEKIVISEFKNAPKIAMDREVGGILIQLMLAGKNFTIPQKEKPFLFQVIEKRIAACQTFSTADFRLILFLATISETPGTAILYLWYIQYWCFSNNVKDIDLHIFCGKIFPNGFLSKTNLQQIWDSQKVLNNPIGTSDNLVDYNSCANSIHFLTVPTA